MFLAESGGRNGVDYNIVYAFALPNDSTLNNFTYRISTPRQLLKADPADL
jgi:hypothetical protein